MKSHKNKWEVSTAQLVLLLIIGATFYWYMTKPVPMNDPETKPRLVTARGDLAADEKNSIDVFKLSSPSVVYITTMATRTDLFTLNESTIPSGTGSGFIWDENGRIVTNYHVIKGASKVSVTLSDNSVWKAQLIGVAADKDLAVLQINPNGKKLMPIPIGNSADLSIGQKVFAIGNPFGLDQTMTSGIVSALGREILAPTGRTIQGVIQTDAAINPGNSGGPLIDSAGRLIGVNTSIISPSGANVGIGFAVPINVVSKVVPELIRHGKLVRPTLGVNVAHEGFARRFGIVNGVLIINVLSNSGADVAGLQGMRRRGDRLFLGDIIVSLEDKDIKTPDDLYRALETYKTGDVVTIGVVRDDAHMLKQVELSQEG
ncbi:MAG TPA: trypsin-like peptidase domain-containing protein [Nitrospinota bacterium]|nr:trypsin-like peptidase domain-containing protein [Nitrospinota bacterium]|tara:strand:- start:108061 stop:109179 length:1119 start_codon:yes stop_codon:yes gene_type:complete